MWWLLKLSCYDLQTVGKLFLKLSGIEALQLLILYWTFSQELGC